MATVLQPIVNELNTVLVQLRTELRGLQTDADGAGIAIGAAVVGVAVLVPRYFCVALVSVLFADLVGVLFCCSV